MFSRFSSHDAATKSQLPSSVFPTQLTFLAFWLCWGQPQRSSRPTSKPSRPAVQRLCSAGSPQTSARTSPPATGGVPPIDAAEEFWGFTNGGVHSMIEAARRYADAIADTCDKYNIDGFDMGHRVHRCTLIGGRYRDTQGTERVPRQLRKRFDESGRMLVIDIPGGVGWLPCYDYLDDDVVESVDYICWQIIRTRPRRTRPVLQLSQILQA